MAGPQALPKMALGFVVRRCARCIGHEPSAEEFADWANDCPGEQAGVKVFGRVISVDEARVILRHLGRPVSARSATAHETFDPAPTKLPSNVHSLAAARARRRS